MELVYLWVEEYKNIHKQGFNFSPRFHCEYNEEQNELTIKENDDYIENFFGKNINITAIVGKNGSGKSSLLEILEIIFCSQKNSNIKIDFKYILICKIDNTIGYISNTKQLKLSKIKSLENIKFMSYFAELPYQFSSRSKFHKYKCTVSLQPRYIMKLILDNFDLEKKFKNQYFEVSTNIFYFYKKLNSNKIQNYLKKLSNRNSVDEENKYQELFGHALFKHTLLHEKQGKGIDIFNNMIQNHSKIAIEFLYYITIFYYIIIKEIPEKEKEKVLSIVGSSNFNPYLKGINAYTQVTKALKDLVIKNNLYDSIGINISFENLVHIIEKGISFSDFNDEILLFENFLDINFKIEKDNTTIDFISLSHGEKTVFGSLLSLYVNLLKPNSKEEKAIFILDEPDLSLHPEWQQQYIQILYDTFKNTNKKIQFVITSHSPFITSDLPKNNIIFLDKSQNISKKIDLNPFGANIHELLSHGFFMNKGLMGEFAKRKINKIKKLYQLTQNENFQKRLEKEKTKKLAQKAFYKRKKRLWQIQKIIGEPFLQKVIKNYLDELEIFFSDDKTLIAKELVEIEKRKKYLEALQKRIG